MFKIKRQYKSVIAEAEKIFQDDNKFKADLSSLIDKIIRTGDETTEVIKTIDEITFQTNLIVLNAAVEAAISGETDPEFRAVANEVRDIAFRAASAAKENKRQIENILDYIDEISPDFAKHVKDIEKIAACMEDIRKQIKAGLEQTDVPPHFASDMNRQAEKLTRITRRLVNLIAGVKSGKKGRRLLI